MAINWQWGAEIKTKGREGFNNAGILTFNSHGINSFVRELFQNSNDAKVPRAKKVRIQIEYSKIDKREIPAFDQFMKIFERVKASNEGHAKLFDEAESLLKGGKIPFLIYSDSNTKGLSGDEKDDKSTFAACVLSEGITIKENAGAGGSFGIGKNAVFGLSRFRTVFYSSLNPDGEHIFQGVAKLASYKIKNINHEGRVYLGKDNDRNAVRRQKDIPIIFRRDRPGLSQFVMGVVLENDWQVEFSKSILRNYWHLLLEDGLEVELLENGRIIQEINGSNVTGLMEKLFSGGDDAEWKVDPKGNPWLFYKAYCEGSKVEFNIEIIGKCNFYYQESTAADNNIAYLRNGMVIHSDIEKRLVGAKVSGVFKCVSKEGNEILRLMEPPRHDGFEPEMLESNHRKFTRKDGEAILKDLKRNIRDVIKTLIEKFKEETPEPEELTKLFADIRATSHSGVKGLRKNERSEGETLHRRAVEDVIEVNLCSEEENIVVSSNKDGIQASGSGTVAGEGPGSPGKSKNKSGKSKGGGSSGRGKSYKHPISGRIFHLGEENGNNIYKAVITSPEVLNNVELSLFQFGDSGEEVAFRLNSVKAEDGTQIKFIELSDKEGGVSEYKLFIDNLDNEKNLILDISDNQKSAFLIKG